MWEIIKFQCKYGNAYNKFTEMHNKYNYKKIMITKYKIILRPENIK